MPSIYSYSKLSAFEQCQLKFKYRYIDKIIPDIEKSIEAYLGEIVHKSLEWLYSRVKENKIPNIEELILHYASEWEKISEKNIPIVKKDTTRETYFNKGVEFLVNYYLKNSPFDENTLELEKKIFINLDKEGEYKIYGIIDRLSFNEKTGEYEVHDYKTAGNLPLLEKIENDKQLSLYAIAVKKMFGEDKEVCLIWHYLAYDKKICFRKTNDQLEKLKKDVIELIKKIESTNNFKHSVSKLCDWCDYRNICAAWKKKPLNKEFL